MRLLDQRQQCGEFKQQHQHQRHHGDRPAARVFHDGQRTLAVAKTAEPGVGAVRQAIEMQPAAEQYPDAQQ
ncbi:hypothetical protein D9M73_229280 [compost metagenome]